jgi:putative endonuclease
MRWPWRRRPKTLGAQGEDLAAKFLKRAGYEILERNAKLGRNEIDIIARDGDTIAFVEVKTRDTPGDAFSPEDNVHAAKQRKLITAAKHYMARHPDPNAYYRFDVVSVVIAPNTKPALALHKDAFHA